MFLDASALIAILGDEKGADHLLARIDAAPGALFYSPLSAYETITGLARKKAVGKEVAVRPSLVEHAEEVVEGFLSDLGATEIVITTEIRREASAAWKRFGRGGGHSAKLNLGDCFAYACARSLRVPLLFKGNDFPLTDIERA
jgi:ribonuclease VapC